MKFLWALLSMALCTQIANAQALPIAIDGTFGDWAGASTHDDPAGDASGLDLLQVQLANDELFLFIKLQVASEFALTENNQLVIYIDSDNNPLTGNQIDGMGVELVIYPGTREAVFYGGSFPLNLNLNGIRWYHLPTVTSNSFEIALPRHFRPDGVNEQLPGPQLGLRLKVTGAGGDQLPNGSSPIAYAFDESPVPPQPNPNFTKADSRHLRMLTWNTLDSGLDDLQRVDHFRRVIKALKPDVVTFNECWDLTAPMVATFMNMALPLGGAQSWKAVKLDNGNVTTSRFPILQSWEVKPGSRLTASLIDLPGEYGKDLLVVNAHLRCCDADALRQSEADAFAAFIRDAKTPGGLIDLPAQTPIVLSGDLNLVGSSQPLETLLEGAIVNVSQYGPGIPPDWDDTPLEDALPLQVHLRMAHTWQPSPFSTYPPSRLDYVIFAGSAMEMVQGFVFRTDLLTPEELSGMGLWASDTEMASDHLPVVVDFELPLVDADTQVPIATQPLFYPNPFSSVLHIAVGGQAPAEAVLIEVSDLFGRVVWSGALSGAISLQTAHWPAGHYIVTARSRAGFRSWQLIKCR